MLYSAAYRILEVLQASFGTGLAHGFMPWETLSALEEVLGALKTIGVSIAQIDNLWSVNGGSLGEILRRFEAFSSTKIGCGGNDGRIAE
nr:hypothetical protein [Tanacetum cinerariifolium]